MKLAPTTTASLLSPALLMIARLSSSDRSVKTCGLSAPGIGRRMGSAPVASSSFSNVMLRPSARRRLRVLTSKAGDGGGELQPNVAPLVVLGSLEEDPAFGAFPARKSLERFGLSTGRSASEERTTSSPAKPSRRSISAAAKPAAPPPTMTKRASGWIEAARPMAFGSFSRTTIRSPENFRTPAGNGIEGRRPDRLAGPQAEAGMMPWAPDRFARDDTFARAARRSGCICCRWRRCPRPDATSRTGSSPDVTTDHAAIGQ